MPLQSHKISCLETNVAHCYCQQQEKATSAIIQATTTVFFSSEWKKQKEEAFRVLSVAGCHLALSLQGIAGSLLLHLDSPFPWQTSRPEGWRLNHLLATR